MWISFEMACRIQPQGISPQRKTPSPTPLSRVLKTLQLPQPGVADQRLHEPRRAIDDFTQTSALNPQIPEIRHFASAFDEGLGGTGDHLRGAEPHVPT